MRTEIERHPEIDHYFATLDLQQFPKDEELREKIKQCLLRVHSEIGIELYHEIPPKETELQMARTWASEFVYKSEGFNVQVVDREEYTNVLKLETCKLAMSPETFKDIIKKTFEHGAETAIQVSRVEKYTRDQMLEKIKEQINDLCGLDPDELRKEATNIIDRYI